MVEFISNTILKIERQYFMDKVKAPIRKALVILAGRYPYPTKQNTSHPNSHGWIDIWDKFFQMEENEGRRPLFEAMFRILISECEHDIYYRDRMNVILELWLEEVFKGNWKPRSLDHPNQCWKVDPNVRGKGYEFLRDKYYHKEVT